MKAFILISIIHLGLYLFPQMNMKYLFIYHIYYSTNYTISCEPLCVSDSIICCCSLFAHYKCKTITVSECHAIAQEITH